MWEQRIFSLNISPWKIQSATLLKFDELSMNNSTSHQFQKSSWRSGHAKKTYYSNLRIKHIQSKDWILLLKNYPFSQQNHGSLENSGSIWKATTLLEITPKGFNAPMILEVEHFHLPGLKLISSNTNVDLGGVDPINTFQILLESIGEQTYWNIKLKEQLVVDSTTQLKHMRSRPFMKPQWSGWT